jgi:galactose-1-phosphate uridylyltransferase
MTDCASCTRDKTKQLIDNRQVCGYCEAWRMECEARWILTNYSTTRRSKNKPMTARDWLESLKARRGEEHARQLREVMASLYRQSQK